MLKPIPESLLTNQDAWPTYQLEEVTIRATGTDELQSLLAANAVVSLVVSGYLAEVEEDFQDQRECLEDLYLGIWLTPSVVDPDLIRSIGTFIEIQAVHFYSYGVYPNGQISVWAAGRAGWYEIRPASEYESIFNHMIKSVELLHFLQDVYEQPKKVRGKIVPVPVQSVFEEV